MNAEIEIKSALYDKGWGLEYTQSYIDEIKADEKAKTIDEVISFISTHSYGWQDLRDFLEQMKGGSENGTR